MCELSALWLRFKDIYAFAFENIYAKKAFLTELEFSRDAVSYLSKLMPQGISSGPNLMYSHGSVAETPEYHSGKKLIFLALLMTWYLKTRCWLIRFGQDSSDSLIPKILGALKKKPEPTALMIIGINKLWDEAKLFELEVLLNFAYHHNFPIYLEFISMEAAQKNRGRPGELPPKSLKFAERLKVAQAKKVSGLLSARQCSLISELSNGRFWLRA